MKYVTLIGGVLLAASLPLGAHAEERPTLLADHRPGSPAGAVELGFGWFTDSEVNTTVHLLRPTLGFRVAVSNSAELTLDWPFAFGIVSPPTGGGDSTFDSGNPVAVAYYMRRSDVGYYRIGGGIAAPVGNGVTGVAPINGLWNVWQHTPDRLSLVIPAQFERRSGGLIYGGDFGLGVLIDTGDTNQDAEAVLQLAGMIGARIDNVSLGTRLQGVWLPTEHGDNAQLALVPFVQADFRGGGFVFARFVLNLDAPFGVFGDRTGLFSKVWGLHIGGGGRF